MEDTHLKYKISNLPKNLKEQVSDFVDLLNKSNSGINKSKRKSGLAKGLITVKDDFDETVEGFEIYKK